MEKNIKHRFDEERAIAEGLTCVSDDIGELLRRYKEIGGEISCDWRGESAHRYLEKFDILGELINKSLKGLDETTEEIKKISAAFYEAEQEALRIAETQEDQCRD